MSMLSGLRDQLREKADFMQENDALMGVGGKALMREIAALMRRAADTIWQLRNDCVELRKENAKLREYIAVSIPLPLDGNRSAIHPDDIIGHNVNGTDFFGRVTEMYLTRYPRDGQPAMWVVRTEDGNGNVSPYVCWGGRCNAVHKQASQTYSAEYLETYDENKRLKAKNAKLRELVRHLYECMCNIDADGNYECDSCEYDNADGGCDFERLMRELRVEVD